MRKLTFLTLRTNASVYLLISHTKNLHVLLTTQSRNFISSKSEYAVDFSSLISIADPEYIKRFNNFIKINGEEDEVEKNYVFRLNWRKICRILKQV